MMDKILLTAVLVGCENEVGEEDDAGGNLECLVGPVPFIDLSCVEKLLPVCPR
jgi:hypothetical protein